MFKQRMNWKKEIRTLNICLTLPVPEQKLMSVKEFWRNIKHDLLRHWLKTESLKQTQEQKQNIYNTTSTNTSLIQNKNLCFLQNTTFFRKLKKIH